MKTHVDTRHSFLQALAVYGFVLPFLVMGLVIRFTEIPVPFSKPLMVALNAAYGIGALGFLFMFIWKGRFIWFLAWWIPVELLVFPALLPDRIPQFPNDRSFRFEEPSLTGANAYCNDVLIGTFPFTIKDSAFRAKVTQLQTPPMQKLILTPPEYPSLDADPTYNAFSFSTFPCDFMHYSNSDYFLLMNARFLMDRSKYWWRYERDDCASIMHKPSFQERTDYWYYRSGTLFQLDVTFPGNEERVKRLLHYFQRHAYQPEEKYIRYIQDHFAGLADSLYQAGQKDPRIMRILDEVIRRMYGIHEGMTEQEITAVLVRLDPPDEESISDASFSVSKRVITLIGAQGADTYARLLENMLQKKQFFTETRRNIGYGISIWRRIDLLSFATSMYPSPLMLNRLFYDISTNPFLMPCLCSFKTPEAEQLMRMYLLGYSNQFRTEHEEVVPGWLQPVIGTWYQTSWYPSNYLYKLNNPTLEKEMRISLNNYSNLKLFIESRLIHDPVINPDELAGWVYTKGKLPDLDILKYMVRIPSTYGANCIGNYLSGNSKEELEKWQEQSVRNGFYFEPHSSKTRMSFKNKDWVYKNTLQTLQRYRNPYYESFLLQAFESTLAGENDGQSLDAIIDAMITNDSNATFDALRKQWDNVDVRSHIVKVLGARPAYEDGLARWMPTLIALQEPASRVMAIPVLAHMGAPEAWDCIKAWSQAAEEDVATAARNALAEDVLLTKQMDDLVDGHIKPDDLLPPSPVYIWQNHQYVTQN